MIHVLLGLSLLLNAFVLAGFIYRSWIAPPPYELPPPPPPSASGPRPSPVETMAHDLKLDDRQRDALSGIVDRYTAARRERMQEIQRIREQTAAEFRQSPLRMAKVEELVDQVSRLRAEQQKETLRTIMQFEPELSSEQRMRMQTILAERFAGPPLPRGRRHGAPPPTEPSRPPH